MIPPFIKNEENSSDNDTESQSSDNPPITQPLLQLGLEQFNLLNAPIRKKYSVITRQMRKEVIKLVIIDKLTYKETSKRTGVKQSTAKAITKVFMSEGRIGKQVYKKTPKFLLEYEKLRKERQKEQQLLIEKYYPQQITASQDIQQFLRSIKVNKFNKLQTPTRLKQITNVNFKLNHTNESEEKTKETPIVQYKQQLSSQLINQKNINFQQLKLPQLPSNFKSSSNTVLLPYSNNNNRFQPSQQLFSQSYQQCFQQIPQFMNQQQSSYFNLQKNSLPEYPAINSSIKQVMQAPVNFIQKRQQPEQFEKEKIKHKFRKQQSQLDNDSYKQQQLQFMIYQFQLNQFNNHQNNIYHQYYLNSMLQKQKRQQEKPKYPQKAPQIAPQQLMKRNLNYPAQQLIPVASFKKLKVNQVTENLVQKQNQLTASRTIDNNVQTNTIFKK